MAIAGKVAITLATENGGAWSADVTYDRLVAVKHNNNLYISRKTVTNVEPPNDEFWFLALEGYSGADVQELINRMNEFANTLEAIITGTQQVGNAKTLDGHGVEYFATAEDMGNINGQAILYDSILDKALSITIDGDYNFKLVGSSYTGNDLPHTDYRYGQATIKVRGGKATHSHTTVILWGSETTNSNRIAINYYDGTSWSGWKIESITSDLANYLPLNNSSSIPRVTVDGATGLILKNGGTYNNAHSIQFEDANGVLGLFGFKNRELMVQKFTNGVESNWFTVLHTGNKPTGTYTGNGDATERTIATGGIGHFAVVWAQGSNDSITLLTTRGGYVKKGTAISGLNRTSGRMQDGVIYISTTDLELNQNGVTYQYEVH